ncbi:MAG TPA: hypothetical protein VHT97_00635 [Acidimicrobiales bacterium]|nr:hypothetical protein [Acidimicrobiales bacterium]
MTNVVPGQYRRVSVATVAGPITAEGLTRHFLGREAYRHTRFIVARAGGETALVRVARTDERPLFSPVTAVEVLALPDECAYVHAPDVDTGVPTALAQVAAAQGSGTRCVVVEGRYSHVSFILDAAPVRVRVGDVVPPGPPKLLDQASRVLALAEDLPPIELVADVVDLVDLARDHPADRYLLPCRGSGFRLDGDDLGAVDIEFLDERPARRDWTLLGCERSRGIHEWFYGDRPREAVELCPRRLFPADGRPLLTKCCLLEDTIADEGTTVVVPWGASLAQVNQALATIAKAAEPAWAPA